MDQGLRLKLLGRPRIECRGRPVGADVAGVKGQALLSYLAMTGRRHSRSALAGLLWGEMAEEAARANLRLTLSRLRKVTGDYLDAGRQAIGLHGGLPCWVDALEFERLADLGELQAALELYEGDFLDDFAVPNAPEFESWVLAERERLRQLAIDGLGWLITAARQSGQLEEGISRARQLLALEPWHEETHRQLMWMLAAAGRRSAALTQYEQCRQLLADELDVEPEPETTALYEQLRAGDLPEVVVTTTPAPPAARPAVPRHNLPPQLTPFIGREAELARLRERLAGAEYRLITIAGEGGVGKTRLALAAGAAVQGSFADGVWFVSLAGLVTPEAAEQGASIENEIAMAAGAALGLTFASAQEPRAQLLNYLRHRRCLLMLDDFQDLLPGRSLVLEIVQQAAGVTLLVTSREPLAFQAEYLLRLEGMPVPERAEAGAKDYDSVRLFAERAERTTGRALDLEAALPNVVEICRFVNGLPLAIELAASLTRWRAPAAIAAGLLADEIELATTMPDVPPRHRNLHTVFEHSWRLLDPAEQETLAQLSVFRGPFQMAAATAVAETSAEQVWALVDKSLVQQRAGEYLALHELLGRFAASRLAASPIDRQALQARHAAFYLNMIGEQAAALQGDRPWVALRQIQQEIENLRQAWQWATQHGRADLLAQGLEGMAGYWGTVGLFSEGEQPLAQAAAQVQGLLDAGRDNAQAREWQVLLARLHAERGYLLYELARYEETAATGRESLRLGEAVGAVDLQAGGRLRLGQAAWGQGDFAGARVHFEEGLALAEAGDSPLLKATLLRNLAAAVWRQGSLDQARQYCLQALPLHHSKDDIRGAARTNYMLAIIAHNQSDYQEAGRICTDILAVAQATGDRRMEQGAHSLLALVASHQGEMDRALGHFEQELRLAREMGALWSQAVALSNLGDQRVRLGDYAGAQAHYQEALRLKEQQMTTPALESNVLAYTGLLAHFTGDHDSGAAYCRQALVLAGEADVPREVGFALLFLAHNLAGRGDVAEAEATYREAVRTWEALGDSSRVMESTAGLARMALARGDVAEARQQVERVLAHLEHSRLEGADDPLRVYLTCYRFLRESGDPRAAELLQEAGRLLQARAGKIRDPALRQTFLQNVPAHRELLKELAQQRPATI